MKLKQKTEEKKNGNGEWKNMKRIYHTRYV